MKYVDLGKSGLKVSVAGLGCGGHSKLGLLTGGSTENATRIVREALDLGINVIDVSDTVVDVTHRITLETIVGPVIKGRRDGLVISTKVHPSREDDSLIKAPEVRAYVEGALKRLGLDTIDVFHLHGVAPQHYAYCKEELLPEMQRLKEKGLIRCIGATESGGRRGDSGHKALSQAAQDGCWDVLMVSFNLLNHCARGNVFPQTLAKGMGIFVMYAVRDVLSRPELLRATIREAVDQGLLQPEGIDLADPLGFLVHEGGATSVIDAAYRFAAYEPGVHTVLSGTGSLEHLRANVESLNRGPLPREDVARLTRLFGHLTHITGNSKERYAENRARKKALGQ